MFIDRVCESCDDEATHEVIHLDSSTSRTLCDQCLGSPTHQSSSRTPVAGADVVGDIQNHLSSLPASLRVTAVQRLRSSLDEMLRGELIEALRELRSGGRSWAEVGRLAGLSRPQVANLVVDRDRRRRSAERAARAFRTSTQRPPLTPRSETESDRGGHVELMTSKRPWVPLAADGHQGSTL